MQSVVYNMDCMDYMRTLPDKAFDLAIVDPPYGILAPKMNMGSAPNRHGKGQYPGISTAERMRRVRRDSGAGKLKNRALNTMKCDWDDAPPTQEYFDELFRVSRNQIIWGGNYFPLPPTRGIVCWDKQQPWENFSQWEMAWTSFDCPAKLISLSNTGGRNDEQKIHPTQKPVRLYEWLLTKFARGGELILDTHVGSGSSRIACAELGFGFVGCEIDKTYWELQEKRFRDYSSQLRLF